MGADQKPKRILLPVRQLQVWIGRNVLLILEDAPFDRENPQLVPAAGSCLDCPKRTGLNKLLFAGISEDLDACSLCGIWANSKSFLLAPGSRADRVGQQATQRTVSTGMSGRIPISSEELL